MYIYIYPYTHLCDKHEISLENGVVGMIEMQKQVYMVLRYISCYHMKVNTVHVATLDINMKKIAAKLRPYVIVA